jgi:hypothetical protein
MFEALQEEIYFYQLFINCQLIMNNFPLEWVWFRIGRVMIYES